MVIVFWKLQSVFHDRFWVSNEDVQLFTDSAAGKGLGFGAVFGNMWAHGVWPEMWHMSGITSDITVLEMFPILVSLVVWGPYLPNKKIRFRCDNEAVVHILNTMTSRSEKKMILVRATTLECMKHNMVIKITHIAGKTNVLCDLISRLCTAEISRISPGSRQRASAQLAFFINLQRAVIGPSATLTGR